MRADRLLGLILLLQTRGKMTAEALADELEVSRRTILRDVDALSFLGVPIYTEGGHGGGISLDEHYRTSLTGLHEEEVRALFITSSAGLLREVGLGEAAERTLLKLTAALPAQHQPSVTHIRQLLLIDPTWWWQDSQPPPFWDDLQRAVYEDRPIETVYENYLGELVERTLDPYSLVAKSSLWYLVARREGQFRTYRVSRFRHIRLLDTHFIREPDFDLPTHWQNQTQEFVESISEFTFTLRIHPDRISFIRQLMPGRLHILEADDAASWVTVQLHLESMDMAKMLVFGLVPQVEVIEPASLREAVTQTAQFICQHPG